jgi:replicative DNA helicase
VSDILIDVADRISGDAPDSVTIPTGFLDLDKLLNGGVDAGDLVIVAGRPSMGKTAFAVNVADNIAQSVVVPSVNIRQKAALIFSIEMSRVQVVNRIVSRRMRIPASELKHGRLKPEQQQRFYEMVEEISANPIYVADPGLPPYEKIASEVKKFAMNNSTEIGCVLIDYLQLIDYDKGAEVKELGNITRSLKRLAKEIGCPVILISQLSRACEQRQDKRPILSDLRASGEIEQDADKVIFLYRDEYYNPNTYDKGVAEIIVAKHRNGATGTVKTLFKPELTEFMAMAQ